MDIFGTYTLQPPHPTTLGPPGPQGPFRVDLPTLMEGMEGEGCQPSTPEHRGHCQYDLRSPWSATFKEGRAGEPSLYLAGTGL